MRAISDKVRHYRKTFRPPVFYALGSLAFRLTVLLALLIVGLILSDLYLRLFHAVELLDGRDQLILLLFEIPMLFGMLQVYFMGAERRYRQLHPGAGRVTLRTPYVYLVGEKRAYLSATFSHKGNLRELARALVDEWEWRREIRNRTQEPLWRRAVSFFGLPSAANFAAYLTGLLAVFAGIVIATMSAETVFGSLEQLVKDAWKLIWLLWLSIAWPIALCVLPGTAIVSAIKNLGESLVEGLNDQYLSDTAFYRFISEILELDDRGERLLLSRTSSTLYWMARLIMAPIQDIPKVWNRIRRARRLGKRMALTIIMPPTIP
ncbi:hypothetical protein E0D86_04660 [Pseudomonas sp. IC_126]|uniref:hypothetical protein n=1 Tax=Pseudomonas sp. IC_126 TaxID=2547400 RepID=UPI00103FD0EA|nr:hypothetical protein [Pseudomonas sp. IC_126]TCD24496.1 hypothetical protein E0D86_04660 [Pseudomonas sp. IC_126]